MTNHILIAQSIEDDFIYFIYRNSSEEVTLVIEKTVIFTSIELYSYEKEFLKEKFGRKSFEVKKIY